MDRSGRKPLKKLLLILPFSKEGMLLHSCASRRDKVIIQAKYIRRSQRLVEERPKMQCWEVDPHKQPSLWSWHRGQLEGCSTGSTPAVPMQDPTSCSAHCHLRHQIEGQQLLLFREGTKQAQIYSLFHQAMFNLVFTFKLMLLCL